MKTSKKLLLLLLCVALATGCGKKIPKLKNGKEAVVTFDGKAKISVDDLYTEMKDTYALQTLISMIDRQILEDKYKKEIDDAKTYAESTVKTLQDQYGDQLASMLGQSVEGYKNTLYVNKLQENAINDYAKKQVEEKEIKEYYKNKIVGDVEVSHILITADVTDSMSEAEKTTAEDAAKAKAEQLIAELKEANDVKAKFEELAKANSKDEATSSNGGSLGYINYGTISENYDPIIDEALKIKNGKISTKAIKTSLGYHVILRTNQKDKASLDDVKDTIIEKLADEKRANDSTMSVKAMQELRKEYKVEIQDTELQEQYAKYIQNALSQSQNR